MEATNKTHLRRRLSRFQWWSRDTYRGRTMYKCSTHSIDQIRFSFLHDNFDYIFIIINNHGRHGWLLPYYD